MRAAEWFRESTAGQWDNFGPDAQREQQDRAIERHGLVDAGLEWSVASSRWTSAWRTATSRRPALSGRVCAGCGVSLDGRRRQAVVCGERCRSRFRRQTHQA